MQEPWLLHDFDDDFYGEELRLAIVGYIRPEVSEYNNYFVYCDLSVCISCCCIPFFFPFLKCGLDHPGQFPFTREFDREDSRRPENRRDSA